MLPNLLIRYIAAAAFALLLGVSSLAAAEPPAMNPFGEAPTVRQDAVPGYIQLSDGSIHAGLIYLTRDKRLQVYDEKLERQREVPLRVVKQVECIVKREWMEKEWKFKETTNDAKMYTGRGYPTREYYHTITLKDGRTISGPLSAVVYVQPQQSHLGRPDEPPPPSPNSSCSTSATRESSARH